MLDFLDISVKSSKHGIQIEPDFNLLKHKDLMIRGGDFYAIWVESQGLWSMSESDAITLIDTELDNFAEKYKGKFDGTVEVMHLRNSGTRMIKKWHTFCQDDMRDNYHPLDENLIFSNMVTTRKDYASKKLPYPLLQGPTPAYDRITSTLYDPPELHKLEWAIGSIINGDSKKNQKFIVIYGSQGTGKSTELNIVQKLFGDIGDSKDEDEDLSHNKKYYTVCDLKKLGQATAQFPFEDFLNNPLVAIQHDGDLSKIEDNTRLNSLVSHETVSVNTKYAKAYPAQFHTFLFLGTNRPVKITEAKSGLLRRLIDVKPSGRKLDVREYNKAMKQVDFELGAIAWHCKEVYEADPNYYDDYIPMSMLESTNYFYDFVIDSYPIFKKEDGVSLARAYEMYDAYCTSTHTIPMTRMVFKEELKNYFEHYDNGRVTMKDGSRVRSYYSGFKDIDDGPKVHMEAQKAEDKWLIFEESTSSVFDTVCMGCPAQYASEKETPSKGWDYVQSKLADIDPTRLHYVKVPENHIVIDFDIPDENGNKSFEKNYEAALKWPPTYAELSKSGQGIHLHYIYQGDATKLSRIYDEHIEIKVFSGKSSLRRKLTKANNLQPAPISSGLPLKGEDKVVNMTAVKSTSGLKSLIERNLNKEIHSSTKSSIDFIYKILDDAYKTDLVYDVTSYRKRIRDFAKHSTHQSEYCLDLVEKMKYRSNTPNEPLDGEALREFIGSVMMDDNLLNLEGIRYIARVVEEAYNTGRAYDISNTTNALYAHAGRCDNSSECMKIIDKIHFKSDKPIENQSYDAPLVFYDIEVFPNLLLVNYKLQGKDKPVIRLINPTPKEIEELMSYRLVGFNCRRYDNHLIYARMMGYTNEQLYALSQKIISGDSKCFFGEAYNVSYTDIYDFAAAGNKKSLKKLEIEMGIHHQELGMPWDQPVPEELWEKVAEYCDNDVLATEAAFEYLSADWTARQILADLAGMTVNDTTNSLTTRIIFGKNRTPQGEFCYRDLSQPVMSLDPEVEEFLKETCPDMMAVRHGEAGSLLPYFPGYKYEMGKSTYRDEEVGEGGYVYAEPGMYGNVALLDIASMHPHSTIAECHFGPRYTKAYRDIVEGRVSIKHEDWDTVNKMMDGKLAPYVQKVINGELTSKQLADALKTAINSVYGLTSAKFENPFRDRRNVDNIVAKRGALFMIDLKHEVQKRGFTVAHIKTDSIKIPDATPEIIQFVMDYGKLHGYTFEHEATYERMCLINDAVYIAKYKDGKHAGEWTATGKEFAVPYIFKKLFTREEITFDDLCETFAVSKGDLYLDYNENIPSLSAELLREYDDLGKALTSNAPLTLEKMCKKYSLDLENIPKRYSELADMEKATHNLKFVGRVGQFTPIKAGQDAGILYRVQDGKNYAAPGSTGYRWMESEVVRQSGKQDAVDMRYYDELATNAIKDITVYGDYEWFVSDDPYKEVEYDTNQYGRYPVYNIEMPFN